jgi:4'-phosphopantetheinyl transferase
MENPSFPNSKHASHRTGESGLATQDFDLLWDLPPASWNLHAKEVHVWSAWLDQSAEFTSMLASTLALDEKTRAARFRFEQERRRYLTGRGFLRRILAHYTNTTPESLTFRYGTEGKPELDSTHELAFNLSHTGKLLVIAVTNLSAVGIDVERLCRIASMDRIADNYFTKPEQQRLFKCDSTEQRRVFFEIWTMKEAALKRDGRSVAEMRQISHNPDGFVQAFTPSPGCIGSLSLPEKPLKSQFWRWYEGEYKTP